MQRSTKIKVILEPTHEVIPEPTLRWSYFRVICRGNGNNFRIWEYRIRNICSGWLGRLRWWLASRGSNGNPQAITRSWNSKIFQTMFRVYSEQNEDLHSNIESILNQQYQHLMINCRTSLRANARWTDWYMSG